MVSINRYREKCFLQFPSAKLMFLGQVLSLQAQAEMNTAVHL